MRKVYIKWEDIFSHDPWTPIQEAISMMSEPCICETIGYILFENKDAIVICNTQNTESQVCGLIRIPKGCIKDRKAIK